tara:strand:+ start:1443 stop:1694 length:252 start_codon:yes stop_codon:yes gene_type:complete
MKRYKKYIYIIIKMYKELNSYYNFRMSSLLYILDNTKNIDMMERKKVQNKWSVQHNENCTLPNTPIFSGDSHFCFNKERFDIS